MRKTQFKVNHFYHVFNRGVDRRDIFLDDKDYFRFIHNLFELNDENPVLNVKYYLDSGSLNIGSQSVEKRKVLRKSLVDILVFTLMPNHFHLLLRQKRENGIVKFMQKIGTGYTMYFNNKYNRNGTLFEGRFKAVLISRNEHFLYLPHYIHLNPLELIYGDSTSIYWRKRLQFLKSYRWSSFPDYIGKYNFPSVTRREYILNIFGGEQKYKNNTASILREKYLDKNKQQIQDITID